MPSYILLTFPYLTEHDKFARLPSVLANTVCKKTPPRLVEVTWVKFEYMQHVAMFSNVCQELTCGSIYSDTKTVIQLLTNLVWD